jgi:hypothetical protein
MSTNTKSNTKPITNINKDNKFYKTTYEVVKFAKPKYDKIIELYRGTPIIVRVLNVIIPFILTYVFTLIYYKLTLSIIFGVLTFFTMLLYNRPLAYIYIVLYIIIIAQTSNSHNKIIGNPLKQTNLRTNNEPYNCAGNSLIVNSDWFNDKLNGGYFTYSYWLYVNGNNNNINKSNNWNNYRYNEWKSIFYRGSPIRDDQDLSQLVQFPGFWLTPVMNNLVIVFQNGSYVERLEINNIDFNKWMNIIVVVEMKSVSIYINGLLDRTLNLYQNVTLMTNYNLYISEDKLISTSKNQSGFPGSIAYLTYYNYALNVNDILLSYAYYKKIIDSYQNSILDHNKQKINSKLITNNMNLNSS